MIIIVKMRDDYSTVNFYFKRKPAESIDEKNIDYYYAYKIIFPSDDENIVTIPNEARKIISLPLEKTEWNSSYFSQIKIIDTNSIETLNSKQKKDISRIISNLDINKFEIMIEYTSLDKLKKHADDVAHSPLFWVGLSLGVTASISWYALMAAGLVILSPKAMPVIFVAAIVIGVLFMMAAMIRKRPNTHTPSWSDFLSRAPEIQDVNGCNAR